MLKKIGRGISAGVFRFLLFFLAILGAVVLVFGTPAHIKKALVKSGIYNVAVDAAADSAEKSARENKDFDASNISFDTPEIRVAAKKAFPPSFLQSSAENVLDGMYGWLEQKTPSPVFSIDVSKPKTEFANGVGDYLANRVQGLPTCTLAQLRAIGGDLDLFTIPCKPAGINIPAQRQKAVNDIVNNKDLLNKSTVSAQDLPKNDKGQTFSEQMASLPKAFHWLKLAPWILGFLALLAGLGLVLLHDDKRRALRGVGITFASIGAVLIVGFWLINFIFNKVSKSDKFINADNQALQKSGIALTKQLSNDYAHAVLIFALAYILIGAIALGVWWLSKKHPEKSESIEKKPEQTESPKPPEPAKS